MTMGIMLLIVLALASLGVILIWRHSKRWGYASSSAVGLLAWVMFVMLLMGKI